MVLKHSKRMHNRAPTRLVAVCLLLTLMACTDGGSSSESPSVELDVPRGYQSTVRIEIGGQVASFGPFVGYYFRPESTDDLSRLDFVCFNERGFYSSDMPVNAQLFKGQAVLARLPGTRSDQPAPMGRITPVVFDKAPASWLATRPEPQDSYLHFHSLHDGRGARMDGYWIAHEALASFTYDMGGRVGQDSVLYHEVEAGTDIRFAPLIEFDQGPDGK
ncbi:conserved exported protein of unknown function [Pseudodesulfovibrio profundus]|uniref:Lipoprotein n=2 Tax=Pseudodesulfovibrio profundus TaxID=57320 RepID=A0A2C8FEZ0_9BACT|nr:conserved exported protein of unknown function [Pseudodesulfovibrio profundus]